ncbi:PRE C2HC domain-containing protein [Aphis craccivora]|uniref:PRE C2HC domain-containing protein n=1 Tax=Aphis craccivora TaxID=307492 RepID=A0A6G0ZDU5_APHCR|nr:PRE C2HC domain-containing protein [Aphis craccivora]
MKRPFSKTTKNNISKKAYPGAPTIKTPVTQPPLNNISYAESTKNKEKFSSTHISNILYPISFLILIPLSTLLSLFLRQL